MENNKAYLNKLPQVFVLVAATVCLQVFTAPDKSNFDTEQYSDWLRIVIRVLFNSIIFVALGFALNKWKAALIAVGTSIAIALLDLYVFKQLKLESKPESTEAIWYVFISTIFYLPYFVFFLVQKIPAKKLIILFFVVIGSRCFNHVFFVNDSFEFLNRLFHTKLLSDRVGDLVVYIACQLFMFLFYCEMQNYADGKAAEKNTTLVNPGNGYNKASGIIGFWAVKTFVYSIVIGSAHQIQSLRYYFSSFREAGRIHIFYYQAIITTLLCVLVILFCGWYLRKFILEYFISYSITSRFVYWLTLIPVIGLFVWVIMLLTTERKQKPIEKMYAINDLAASESRAVTVIFVIGMLIQFCYVLSVTRSPVPLFFLIADAGMFLWMIASKPGYQVTLWLRITCFASLIIFLFLKSPERDTIAYATFIYPFLLLSIFQLMMIFPVYHFDTFAYISGDFENQPTPSTGDRLTEFDQSPV